MAISVAAGTWRSRCLGPDFMLAVMADPNRKLDQRMEATTWLADRAFDKPAQVVEHGGDPDRRAPILLTWGEAGGEQEGRHGHGH